MAPRPSSLLQPLSAWKCEMRTHIRKYMYKIIFLYSWQPRNILQNITNTTRSQTCLIKTPYGSHEASSYIKMSSENQFWLKQFVCLLLIGISLIWYQFSTITNAFRVETGFRRVFRLYKCFTQVLQERVVYRFTS